MLEQFVSPNCCYRAYQPLAGGCIHQSGKLQTTKGSFFLKWNAGHTLPMFKAEIRGLETLRAANSGLRIPVVYGLGKFEGYAVLLMEFLPHQPETPRFWEHLGQGLAQLHRCTAEQFGFDSDNFIGALPQSNRWHQHFVEFFVHQRLEPQLHRAEKQRLLLPKHRKAFERLFTRLSDLLPDEKPALLHGDLWGGNCFSTVEQQAVVVDPAVYYGHREAELAFTLLFGEFHSRFYEVYDATYPLLPDWRQRAEIYNLYPLLVHLNLFGTSYRGAIESVLKRYG